MAQREFQIRITDDTGEEFINCFTDKKDALKAYQQQIQQTEYSCEIELLEVLAQHTIVETNSSANL